MSFSQSRPGPDSNLGMLSRRLGLFAVALLASLLACSTSSTSGGVYESTNSANGGGAGKGKRLADSKIQLETTFSFKRGSKPAIRTMLARNGVVRATVDTGRRRGEAEIPPDVYAALWSRLMDEKALELEVSPPKTDGGLYHIVRLTIGGKTGEFSGQQKTNFLGLQSSSIRSRLEVVNHISRVFNKYVKTDPVETEPSQAATTSPTPQP